MRNTEEIWRLVDAQQDDFIALSDRVWEMPELCYRRIPILRRTHRDAGGQGLPRHPRTSPAFPPR